MYNKLFSKITKSSIWLAPDPHRIVWITLLALMDEDGFVECASARNLAHIARVSEADAAAAVESFEGPDPESGDQDNEGRRIERGPGGWYVLNAAKYRAISTREHQRIGTRERMQRWRDRQRQQRDATGGNGVVTRELRTSDAPVTGHYEGVTTSYSEAEAEAERSKNTSADSRPRIVNVKPPKPPLPAELAEIRVAYPKRSGSQPWDRAAKACRARITEGASWPELIEGAKRYAAYCRATGKLGSEYVMQAATFYGPERHYLGEWIAPNAPGAPAQFVFRTAAELEAMEAGSSGEPPMAASR